MLGSLNPLPFRVGGGPTPSSRAYQVIRQAVGKGGSAENDLGIDGLWRRSRAKGLAAATSSTRRALLQAFPHLATDSLPYWERRYGLIPAVDATEANRRDAVVERYAEQPVRNWNDLEAKLKAIDARFSISMPSDAEEIVTMYGRGFDQYDTSLLTNGPPFVIACGLTQIPAYSSRQVLRVRLALGYAMPTPADYELIARARRLLCAVLPSDEDFAITTGDFILGETPLGYGALS